MVRMFLCGLDETDSRDSKKNKVFWKSVEILPAMVRMFLCGPDEPDSRDSKKIKFFEIRGKSDGNDPLWLLQDE